MSVTFTDGGFFGTGATPVTTSAGSWTLIGVIPISARRGRLGLQLAITSAPLTNLKITRSLALGGHDAGDDLDLAVDTDLNTATMEVQNVLPINAYQAIAGSKVQIILNCDGVAEYGIWAKGSSALVTMNGRLPNQFV